MKYFNATHGSVRIEGSAFSNNDVSEFHILAESTGGKSFELQTKAVLGAVTASLFDYNVSPDSIVFIRYFLSDSANQAEFVKNPEMYSEFGLDDCAVSIVQQPPVNGGKVGVWAYAIHAHGQEIKRARRGAPSELSVLRGDYEHVWSAGLTLKNCGASSFDQTNAVFADLNKGLENKGYSLEKNCVRTWLFVKDIDFNYAGVVEARRKFFEARYMTKDTHFIASTGIEGRCADPGVSVLMDAYSLGGVSQDQIRFLKAADYLNPTHEYGVTFERGTSVDFGDRRHVYISGTASIDAQGEIVCPKDINGQIARTFVNISALLAEVGAAMNEVAQMIVYIRDIADSEAVNAYLAKHYPSIPKITLLAPVCRPGWLVEIECIAIKKSLNPAWGNF